jgi:hypothetical protein
MFPELQCLETRFGGLSLAENRYCAKTIRADGAVHLQDLSVAVLRFCLEGTSSKDHAQFTITVTAVGLDGAAGTRDCDGIGSWRGA